MKKFLLLLTIMVVSFGVVACGNNKNNNSNKNGEFEIADVEKMSPEETAVVGFLEAVKQADFAKINEYVTENDMMYSEDTTEEKIIFENIT